MNTYLELVRLPAALSTPGDSLLGSAASGDVRPLRAAGLALSSALLYSAGMALNDYADRDVDATERPGRPIPSGRVSAPRALALGSGLMAAGVLVATLTDGRRGFLKSSVTAGAVLTYDFIAKGTPAGPPVMASCRFFDVVLGSTNVKAALAPASLIAAHTLAITGVSAYEVAGGPESVGKMSAIATASVTAGALLSGRRACLSTATAAALYAAPSLQASKAAMDDPTPQRLQKIVGTGVMGMIPLQGALIAGRGKPLLGGAVTALWPLARMFSKKRRVT